MSVLVDTNVLLRLVAPADPRHESARNAIDFFDRQGRALSISGQNLVEFWNVATRPKDRNGLGFRHETARQAWIDCVRYFL